MSSSGSSWKQSVGTAVRFGIAVLILTCLVLYIARSWSSLVREQTWELSWGAMAVSLLLLLLAQAAMFLGWHLTFYLMGGRAALPVSARSYFFSQLAKYVPGKVMTVVTRAYVLRDARVREELSVAAQVVEAGLVCVSAVVVGAACVLFVPAIVDALERPWLVMAGLVVPLGLLAVHPRLMEWLMNVAARVLKRDRIGLPTTYAQLLLALLVFCGVWVILGSSVALLAQALGYARPPLALAIGGCALSWVIGFVAFITPGGLGVREVVLMAALALVLPTAGAAAVALGARVQVAVCEVLWGAAVVLQGRIVKARSKSALAEGAQEGGGS